MMTIITDTYIPYEYTSRIDTLRYIESRCHNVPHSLRRIEKDNEHLTVRCPFSGDYLEIHGITDDLEWLDKELSRRQWYRLK